MTLAFGDVFDCEWRTTGMVLTVEADGTARFFFPNTEKLSLPFVQRARVTEMRAPRAGRAPIAGGSPVQDSLQWGDAIEIARLNLAALENAGERLLRTLAGPVAAPRAVVDPQGLPGCSIRTDGRVFLAESQTSTFDHDVDFNVGHRWRYVGVLRPLGMVGIYQHLYPFDPSDDRPLPAVIRFVGEGGVRTDIVQAFLSDLGA